MSKNGRQVLSFDRSENVPFELCQTKGVTLVLYSPVILELYLSI